MKKKTPLKLTRQLFYFQLALQAFTKKCEQKKSIRKLKENLSENLYKGSTCTIELNFG